jgi:hypothetical protein
MEAARSSEMSAKVCDPTRRHALDNNILQNFSTLIENLQIKMEQEAEWAPEPV